MKRIKSLLLISVILFIILIPKEKVYAFNSVINSYDLADLEINIDGNGLPYIEQYKTEVEQEAAWNEIFIRYKGILTGLSGLLTLTFVVLFMKTTFDFGKSADNPQERQKCIKALLWTGIGTGGFAATTLIMALAFRFLQ